MVILRGCGERLRFSRGDGDEFRGNTAGMGLYIAVLPQ